MCYKKKKFCTFLASQKMANFIQKFGNINVVKKIFVLVFLKLLKNKIHLGRVSPSPFMQNFLIKTGNTCFKNFLSCALSFSNVMKFRRLY